MTAVERPERASFTALLPAIVGLVAATSCGGGGGGRGSIVTNLSLEVCDPAAGPFTTAVTHRFFPLAAGRQLVLEGEDDGEALRLLITVLGESEAVAGVATRVVEERETVGGELDGATSTKVYASGVGLVKDDAAELVSFQ